MAEPNTKAFVCPHCKQPAVANIAGSASWSGRNVLGMLVGRPVDYALLQCERCEEVSVEASESVAYEPIAEYDEFEPLYEPEIVYPALHELSDAIPVKLRQDWEEARACFRAYAYAASVVMVRRILEGTCVDLGVSNRSLAASLRELRTHGLIDGTLSEWADVLRLTGNMGAHHAERSVTHQDAADALDFAEAFLDHVYVLRGRFVEFKQRVSCRPESERAD